MMIVVGFLSLINLVLQRQPKMVAQGYVIFFVIEYSYIFCAFLTLAVLQRNPGGVDLYYAMHCLSNEDIDGLPPGGGLASK